MYAKQLEYIEVQHALAEDEWNEYDYRLKRYSFSGLPCERSLNSDESNQMREAMIKGYMEMASINLAMAEEFNYAECEATDIVERLVSGG